MPAPSCGGRTCPKRRIRRRYAAERRFRLYGVLAIGFAVFMLGFLAVTVVAQGYSAFWQTRIALDVNIDAGQGRPGRHPPAGIAQHRRLPGGGARFPARPVPGSLLARRPPRAQRFPQQCRRQRRQAHGDGESQAWSARRSASRCWPPTDIDMLAKGRISRDAAEGRPADQGPGDRLVRQAGGGGRASAAPSMSISSRPAIRANRSRPGSAAP